MAIFLLQPYRGGTLRAAKNLAKSIQQQANAEGYPLQVVFSCIAGHYDLELDFLDLYELGIQVRETKWEMISREQVKTMAYFDNVEFKETSSQYMIPFDGASDFYDCEYWFFVTDRCNYLPNPLKKYGVLVHDYIQRYVPQIFNTDIWETQEKLFMPFVRNASLVFTTTPSTRNDMISYASVNSSKIQLLNFDFEPIKDIKSEQKESEKYFVWVTNTAQHKNHIRAIKALIRYYEVYNGSLKVIITGDLTDLFDHKIKTDSPYHYVNEVRSLIKKNSVLHKKIKYAGNVNDMEYASILKRACFLWHTNLYDNGTYSVCEAAYLGTPSLSSKYPPMEYINQTLSINLTFFDPYSIDDMAKKLIEMEENYKEITLPSPEYLEQFNWKKNANSTFQVIKQYLFRGDNN